MDMTDKLVMDWTEEPDFVVRKGVNVIKPVPLDMLKVSEAIEAEPDDFFGFLWEMDGMTADSTTSVIRESVYQGEPYVVKEVRPESWSLRAYSGVTLADKASLMNRTFRVLREHLDERIVATLFVVVKDAGEERLYIVQPKIEGEKYDVDSRTRHSVVDEIAAAFAEARRDEEFQRLPTLVQDGVNDWIFGTDGSMIETEEGELVLVDW